jgi:putative cell wall-binding protein
MRKGFSAAAIGLSVFAMLTTTAGAITTASASTGTCTAVNGPASMNDLPATADCGSGTAATAGAVQDEALSPNFGTAKPTTLISSTPIPFSHTNGDILAVTEINGASNELAIGGNFSTVTQSNGKTVPAIDFAVLNATTGDVIYAPSGTGTDLGPANSKTKADKYVRSFTSLNGTLYVGGDFDHWDGTARSHVVALDSSFNVTAWNPGAGGDVRALATDGSSIYIGGEIGQVAAVDTSLGAQLWAQDVSGGSVHALLATNGVLYVGGLFETYGSVTQHGLVEVNTSNGTVIPGFNMHLRPDINSSSTTGTDAYSGEDPISLSVGPNPSEILVGCGGHAPPGESSNEANLVNATTGARYWTYSTIGDGQAIGSVGDTTVVGYHNSTNQTVRGPYYAAQLENSNGAETTWDPKITGETEGNNDDAGNGGVQAMYVDQNTGTIYMGGAFSLWNGASGHQSLIAFTFAVPPPSAPDAPTIGTATPYDSSATLTWTAPLNDGGAPVTDYHVTVSPSIAGNPVDVGNTTSATISGLKNNTKYTFKVAAINSIGTGPNSGSSNSVTPKSSLGSAPGGGGGGGGTTGGGGSSGGGGGGGVAAPVGTVPVRIAGADRFGTADAALAAEFPTAGSAGAVVLATASNYPDALIGTALAAAKNAPLLFVSGSLSADTQADIVRVLPPGGTVYLLGGTAAIPDSVSTALKALGFAVTRYAGTDRYGTALAVAAGLNNPGTVFLATGNNFPDALTAGPAAAHLHGVVLLTDGSTLPAAVKTYLTAHPGTVYAVGAPAAAADPTATKLAGADRYATAVAVDTSVFAGGPTTLGVASGVQFPDALSGGVYQAHFGGAMVLSDPAVLPTTTSAYLTSVKSTVTTTAIFGGSAALSASVQTAIDAALGF